VISRSGGKRHGPWYEPASQIKKKKKKKKLPLGYCCKFISHKQMVSVKSMQYKRKRANNTSSLARHGLQHHSSLLAGKSRELQGFAPGLGQVLRDFCTSSSQRAASREAVLEIRRC